MTRHTRRAQPLAVAVQLACRARGLPAERSLRAWARAATGRRGAITLRVVGAAEAQRLNATYRRRDHATNVLSFAYDAPQARRRGSLRGDIVLCHPVIAREAKAQGKALGAHYAHMVVHGMLHLCGLDHHRERQAKYMEGKEKRLLRALGFGDPYLPPQGVRRERGGKIGHGAAVRSPP